MELECLKGTVSPKDRMKMSDWTEIIVYLDNHIAERQQERVGESIFTIDTLIKILFGSGDLFRSTESFKFMRSADGSQVRKPTKAYIMRWDYWHVPFSIGKDGIFPSTIYNRPDRKNNKIDETIPKIEKPFDGMKIKVKRIR